MIGLAPHDRDEVETAIAASRGELAPHEAESANSGRLVSRLRQSSGNGPELPPMLDCLRVEPALPGETHRAQSKSGGLGSARSTR